MEHVGNILGITAISTYLVINGKDRRSWVLEGLWYPIIIVSVLCRNGLH
jgi:hypothetical protein